MLRFPSSPSLPVQQNVHAIAHPSWLDTHSVIRSFAPPALSCSRTTGMSTVSIFPPLPSPRVSSNTSFTVPSEAECSSTNRSPPSTVATASNLSLNAFENPFCVVSTAASSKERIHA